MGEGDGEDECGDDGCDGEVGVGEVLAEIAHHPAAGAEASVGHLGGDEHGCGAEDDGGDDAYEDHGDGVDDAFAL